MEGIIKTHTSLQVFNDLVNIDKNLNIENLDAVRRFLFDTNIPIIDPLTILSSISVHHPMFVWPPEDGFLSVARRGFYKIVSDIIITDELFFSNSQKYKSYKAMVQYSPSVDAKEYYQFPANIGPLVNSVSVIFDVSPDRKGKVLKFSNQRASFRNKDEFLKGLVNKVFYVSLQQRMDESLDSIKQTFWFKLE